MRSPVLAASFVILIACAKSEPPPEPAAPPPPPPLTPADFAGTWNTAVTLTGVEKPVETVLTGSADGMTWTMSTAGRDPVSLTASMSGDSLVLMSAEYESFVRKGVMVTTRTASVKSGEMLMGNAVATYKAKAGEEVVLGTTHSTRATQ